MKAKEESVEKPFIHPIFKGQTITIMPKMLKIVRTSPHKSQQGK